jgi:hypothetical protein
LLRTTIIAAGGANKFEFAILTSLSAESCKFPHIIVLALAPGVISRRKAREMLKNARNQVNPNPDESRKHKK